MVTATHEVANCDPDEIVAPADAIWEPCVVLRTTKNSVDVQIVADGQRCERVPKRFLSRLQRTPSRTKKRKRKRSKSYGWTKDELAMLEQAIIARRQALLDGKTASREWYE